MKTKLIKISIIIVIFIILVIFSYIVVKNTTNTITTDEVKETINYDTTELLDTTIDYDKNNTNYINLLDNNITSSINNVSINKNTLTITNPGTYYIKGTLSSGNIIINTSDNANIHLILDNVNINSNNYSSLYVKNAKKVVVTLLEGTNNTFSDNTTYTNLIDNEPDATIFSHDDLSINGKGILNIKANYLDALACKDDLVILSSTINITSKDDGIRSKDSLSIKDSTINITSNGDSIKTTNIEDTTKGNINITNSKITLNTLSSDISSKGIKAGNALTINSGTYNINSIDDSLHASKIYIKDGTYVLSSNDDGVHADSDVIIDNGSIDITKSYEGIEGLNITINNGNIKIVASDDGINGAGGVDSSGTNNNDRFNNSGSNALITINGGTIDIKAATSGNGDSIDSNGSIVINNGTIKITSPASYRDYDALDSDGGLTMNGDSVYIDNVLYDASNINSTQKGQGNTQGHPGKMY